MHRPLSAWSLGDPAALTRAVAPAREVGGAVLVFGGSGDEALGLLALGLPEVQVVEPDPGARALLALKHAAAHTLPLATLRSVMGLDEAGRRLFLYHYVRDGRQEGAGPPPPGLSGAERAFWDAHEDLVRRGISGGFGALDQAAVRLRATLRRLGLHGAVERSLHEGAPPLWAGRRWSLALRRTLRALLPSAEQAQVRARLPALAEGGDPRAHLLLGGALPPALPPAPWLCPEGLRALRGEDTGGPRRLACTAGLPGPALSTRRPASLAAVCLDLATAGLPLPPDLLPAAARALRPAGLLVLRPAVGAAPPDLPAGLHLDVVATGRLRGEDRGLLGGPPLVLQRG